MAIPKLNVPAIILPKGDFFKNFLLIVLGAVIVFLLFQRQCNPVRDKVITKVEYRDTIIYLTKDTVRVDTVKIPSPTEEVRIIWNDSTIALKDSITRLLKEMNFDKSVIASIINKVDFKDTSAIRRYFPVYEDSIAYIKAEVVTQGKLLAFRPTYYIKPVTLQNSIVTTTKTKYRNGIFAGISATTTPDLYATVGLLHKKTMFDAGFGFGGDLGTIPITLRFKVMFGIKYKIL